MKKLRSNGEENEVNENKDKRGEKSHEEEALAVKSYWRTIRRKRRGTRKYSNRWMKSHNKNTD